MAFLTSLDSLRADAIYGWRRLTKTKITSAAAILSLALAVGACTSAFRLIDALLWRPLPIAHPERLSVLTRHSIDFDGKPTTYDSFAGPDLQLMRSAAKGQAELIAVSSQVEHTDLTYASDQEMEKAYLQYASGWMWTTFGLTPAAGRLLTERDDLTPGANPVAVISYDYWTRRFARDPKAIGRTFHLGTDIFEIVGVAPKGFTGTETGTFTDVFIPTMMSGSFMRSDSNYLRALIYVNPGVNIEPLRQKLEVTSRAFDEDRAKGFRDMPQKIIAAFLNQSISMDAASSGTSNLQKKYSRALISLAILAALVLLIACANLANLMTAQAAMRSKEMALRVSIGAGRRRLLQLVFLESAWIATLASALGAMFAWWSAPLVVAMINPSDRPARLDLPADSRVLLFGIGLTLLVTFLFGLFPALRASSVKPSAALKGGDRPRVSLNGLSGLIAVQVAFCFLILFAAGLFVTTLERLSNQPTGFSADRILTLNVVTSHPQTTAAWEEVANHLRDVSGVETVAIAGWPLLSGTQSNNFVSIHGEKPSNILAFYLNVSPGWLDAMKIPLLDGRDFRASDLDTTAAIVNETFVKTFFNGQNPIGKTYYRNKTTLLEIVGVTRDAHYGDVRELPRPVVYVPFARADPARVRDATLIVRTASQNPLALASILRQEVPRARPEFRVSNIRSQEEINQSHMISERLLATLALFFSGVAVLLAGVGLYGILHYSVVQRRRELGIRLAIGAPSAAIARLVTSRALAMVALGAVAGLALGLASVHYVQALLFDVKPSDGSMLAIPGVTILATALLAALPAVLNAIRIDPAETLRSE